MEACTPGFEGFGEIPHSTLKKTKKTNRNTIFLSKFSLKIQASSNFTIREGQSYNNHIVKIGVDATC